MFKDRGLGWGATSYPDYKTTWQMKNSNKDSGFYSTRIQDRQAWISGDLKWNVIWPIYATYVVEI